MMFKEMIESYNKKDEYELSIMDRVNKMSYQGTSIIIVILYIITPEENPLNALFRILLWSNMIVGTFQKLFFLRKNKGSTKDIFKNSIEDSKEERDITSLQLVVLMMSSFLMFFSVIYDFFKFIKLTY